MESGAPDQNQLDTLNAIELNEDELFEVINKVGLVTEPGASSLTKGWIAQKELCEKVPERTKAIMTRLHALSSMMENDELKRWLLADGTSLMPAAHKALISATANHPLSIINGNIEFEKESFLQRILELVEPVGSRRN
jgi:hypothetical protein